MKTLSVLRSPDLSEGAVGVPPAAGDADPVGAAPVAPPVDRPACAAAVGGMSTLLGQPIEECRSMALKPCGDNTVKT